MFSKIIGLTIASLLVASALVFFVVFAEDSQQVAISQSPEAANYWKETASFHFIDAQLQRTLKTSSELTIKLESARVAVDAAKEKLSAACGKDHQLDPVKFEKGELACIESPKAVK